MRSRITVKWKPDYYIKISIIIIIAVIQDQGCSMMTEEKKKLQTAIQQANPTKATIGKAVVQHQCRHSLHGKMEACLLKNRKTGQNSWTGSQRATSRMIIRNILTLQEQRAQHNPFPSPLSD